nr:hypothetical protein Iba_chr06aCG12620 [Ipomoea batatas]GMD43493.1 hypothetical protein Iba_chr10cCG5850 [Ipomoea batatas]
MPCRQNMTNSKFELGNGRMFQYRFAHSSTVVMRMISKDSNGKVAVQQQWWPRHVRIGGLLVELSSDNSTLASTTITHNDASVHCIPTIRRLNFPPRSTHWAHTSPLRNRGGEEPELRRSSSEPRKWRHSGWESKPVVVSA